MPDSPLPTVERVAYSPAECAAALGCTRQHVQNMIQRGELPSFKLGARRFIPAHVFDDLEAGALGRGRLIHRDCHGQFIIEGGDGDVTP